METYKRNMTDMICRCRCWDGKNLDSPNHRDHVAHPVGGPVSFANVGAKCPESHPIKIPQVMLEVFFFPCKNREDR